MQAETDITMTDSELGLITGAIVTAGSALGGMIRWSAGIYRAAVERCNKVIEDNTAAMIRMSEMFGRVDVRTVEVRDRVVEIHEEISDVHRAATDGDVTPVEIPPRPTIGRKPTPPAGTYFHSTKRKGSDHE